MPEPTAPAVDLKRWLTHHGAGDRLTLTHAQVVELHHEMLRQRQSADRLRKQNRRLRAKDDRLLPSAGGEPTGDAEVAPDRDDQ